MTTPAHRADRFAGPLQLVLRLVLALAVALLSVPLLGSPAGAEGTADATSTEAATEPAPTAGTEAGTAEEAPAEEPAQEPAAVEQPAEEPAAEEEPAPAEEEPATVDETVEEVVDETETTTLTTMSQLEQLVVASGVAGVCDTNNLTGTVDGFDQNTREDATGSWINGALNQNNSDYAEGDFVPQRVMLSDLQAGENELVFTFDMTKGGLYAYDYVDHLQILGEPGATISWDAPAPPADGTAELPAYDATDGTATVTVHVTFQMPAGTDGTAIIRWDGHIAAELDYGPDMAAGTINGAPYHISLDSLNCASAGSRDNQLMADAVNAGEITVIKDATPNGPTDFNFTIEPGGAASTFFLDDDADATLPSTVTFRVAPGTYDVSEVDLPQGWTLTGLSCVYGSLASNGAVNTGSTSGATATTTVVDDGTTTCTFDNSRTATVEVDKLWIVNGGTPVAEGSEPAGLQLGAQLRLDGADAPWNTPIGGHLVGDQVAIDETTTIGNALCRLTGTTIDTGDGALPETVTLHGGANRFTVTNSVTCDAGLTLVKTLGQVGNAGDGPATPGDWTLTATPADTGDLAGPSGATGTPAATGTITADASYTLSESGGDPRYVQDGPWTCTNGVTVTDSTVSVPAGSSTTCTVENVTSRVTLVKNVTNDDGGSAVAGDWTLRVGSHDLGSGDSVWLRPGQGYALSEHDGPSGYTQTSLTCSDAPTAQVTSVTPQAGEDLTCTFVNDDLAAGLTLIKNVVDPDGSLIDTELMKLDFLLTATDTVTGQVALSGSGSASSSDLPAGSYALAESYQGDADDFIEGDWVCLGGSFEPLADVITLGNGDGAVCTVTNTAVAPQLTLVKDVPQDDTSGADLDPAQWMLSADHPDHDAISVAGGFGPVTVPVGAYELAESGPGAPAWDASAWTCNEGIEVTTDGQGVGHIDLELGDVAVCRITNTPVAPQLTLVKEVAGNEATGGTGVPADWRLTATHTDDPTVVLTGLGGADGELPIGTYALDESLGLPGYAEGDWVCDGVIAVDDQVALGLGDDVTCTITNTAQPSTLTLLKTVDPNGTGDETPASAWTLEADGPTAFSGSTGVSRTVTAGSYDLSESGGPSTHSAGPWSCVGATAVDDSVLIGLDQDVTCTIVNTAIPGDWSVAKSAAPPSGSTVLPGDEITYTLTVTHGGSGVPVEDVQVTDDLTDVLDNATVVGTPTASDGTATITGTTLTWDIPEVNGTHTVSYTVRVDPGEHGETLRNVVTSPNCPTAADCITEHVTPHFDLVKTSVPADGATVQPGDQVTYTLTATNDSDAVLQGATATDDLSGVLDDAMISAPLAAGLTLPDGSTTLTWAIPTLQPGGIASVSYTVTVDADAWDQHLRNVVTPGAGGDCPPTAAEPDCETDHPTPHYVLWKTNVPGDGATVEPGQSVIYTLHLTNDSDAVLSGHTVTDELADVLDDATVTSLGAGLTLPPDGTLLTWAVPDVDPGQTVTASYTVLVGPDAWDEHLVNLVTPGDAGECVAPGCTTDNPTPHWVLTKSSDPASGSTVMPGDTVTYTLTVENDSDGVVTGGVVTDDLTLVLDNAVLDLSSLGAGVTPTPTGLVWELPVLQPGDVATTSYSVTMGAGQWDADLVNVATPDLTTGGECVTPADCTTTHETPPVTTLVVQKVDFETAEPLAGATFVLYDDNEPFADPADPVIGDEDVALGSRQSGLDGLAAWAELLPGHYLVEETVAPEGYLLPEQPVMAVTIDESNFVAGGEMAPIAFRDFAEGLLSVVAKRQFELVGTEWVESDGFIDHGELVKYVVSIEAIGPKLFHNVEVSDYVPGFNPEDTTSTAQAELVPGSAICTGALEPICDVSVSEDNLVTWTLGGGEPVTDVAGDVEMVVQFPEEPADPEFDEDGEFRTVLWNVGYLEYDEVVGDLPDELPLVSGGAAARGLAGALAVADFEFRHTRLRSNEVVIEAVLVDFAGPVLPPSPPSPPTPPNPPQPGVVPTPPVLPDTGASAWLVQLAALGALALALGLGLAVTGRRRDQPEMEGSAT